MRYSLATTQEEAFRLFVEDRFEQEIKGFWARPKSRRLPYKEMAMIADLQRSLWRALGKPTVLPGTTTGLDIQKATPEGILGNRLEGERFHFLGGHNE